MLKCKISCLMACTVIFWYDKLYAFQDKLLEIMQRLNILTVILILNKVCTIET